MNDTIASILQIVKRSLFCRVAGTVGLASTAVMGISESYHGPLEPVYKAALSLGIANQLTNVLRDVGEDIDERDRIYLPTDELDRFGITEKEVSSCLQFTQKLIEHDCSTKFRR